MRFPFARLIVFGVPVLLLMGAGCRPTTPSSPQGEKTPSVSIMDADGKAVTGIRQEHVIGTSPCPTSMAPIRLEVKGDEHPPEAKPKTDAKWLTLPDVVKPGEWFIPRFNCDITDYTPHAEEADVTFDWQFGDATGTEDAPGAQHAFGLDTYRNLDVKLRARTDVCTSPTACPPPEDAPSRSQGIDSVTWAKPCPSDSACAEAGGGDGGWFGTATDAGQGAD